MCTFLCLASLTPCPICKIDLLLFYVAMGCSFSLLIVFHCVNILLFIHPTGDVLWIVSSLGPIMNSVVLNNFVHVFS